MKLADKSARVPATECPICGKKLDAASSVSDTGAYHEPRPGSLTVCVACGGWLIFKADMTYRRMNADDIGALDSETHSMMMTLTKIVQSFAKEPN